MQYILSEKHESVLEIILNRPPVNALNEELVDELKETVLRIDADPDVRSVVLRSNQFAFVAGADIKMMQTLRQNQETGRMLNYVKNLQEVLFMLENLSKPTIAYINGAAMGGGLELALACDFRVMENEKARIGLPEVQLGMIPGAGGTQRLTRLVGETKAKQIIYFSRHLTAEEAYDLGIVSYVVPSNEGVEETYEIAKTLAEKAPLSIAGVKRSIQSAGQSTLGSGYEKEMSETARVFTSDDSKTGFDSFLDKKEPVFTGN